jgi:hypothetical protein
MEGKAFTCAGPFLPQLEVYSKLTGLAETKAALLTLQLRAQTEQRASSVSSGVSIVEIHPGTSRMKAIIHPCMSPSLAAPSPKRQLARSPAGVCRSGASPPIIHHASDWLTLPLKHVVESQQFDQAALDFIFSVAREMEGVRPGSAESQQLRGAIMSTLFYEPSTRTRLSFESAMARLGGTVLSTESAGEYSSAAKGETLEGGLGCLYLCQHVQGQRGRGGRGRGGGSSCACCEKAALRCACMHAAKQLLVSRPRSSSFPTLAPTDTIRTVEGYADCIVLRHFQAGSAKRAAAASSISIINAGDGPGQHPTQVRGGHAPACAWGRVHVIHPRQESHSTRGA